MEKKVEKKRLKEEIALGYRKFGEWHQTWKNRDPVTRWRTRMMTLWKEFMRVIYAHLKAA